MTQKLSSLVGYAKEKGSQSVKSGKSGNSTASKNSWSRQWTFLVKESGDIAKGKLRAMFLNIYKWSLKFAVFRKRLKL